jgi:hypothetical protein
VPNQSEPWPTPENAAAWRPEPPTAEEVNDAFVSISVPVTDLQMRAWKGEYQHHFGWDWRGPRETLSTIIGEAGDGMQIFSRMYQADDNPERPRRRPMGGRGGGARQSEMASTLVGILAAAVAFLTLCAVAWVVHPLW